jgi:hypothetical protein
MGALAIMNLIQMCFNMLKPLAAELQNLGVLPADHPLHAAVADVGQALPDAKAAVVASP